MSNDAGIFLLLQQLHYDLPLKNDVKKGFRKYRALEDLSRSWPSFGE